jgi:protein kinase-like protein
VPRRSATSIGALATAGALACGVYASIDRTRPHVDTSRPVAAFEAKLGEKAAALSARVATLSELPRLASAVATDATTVRDLTTDELAFRPREGEIVTIAQRLRDGRRVSLLTLPEGAEPEDAAAAGTRTKLSGGRMYLSRTVAITPTERADELTGLLTITSPVETADLAPALLAAAPGARIEIGAGGLAFGGLFPPGPESGTRVPAHLPGGETATLVFATRPPGEGGPLWALGGGLLVIALIAFTVGSRRRSGVAQQDHGPAVDDGVGGPTPFPSRAQRASITASESAAAPPSASPSPREAAPSPLRPATAPLAGGPGASAALAPTLVPASGSTTGTGEQRIGRYTIVRPLGQGGMAEVFLARAEGEAGFGKLVAFKVLQAAFASNPAVVELFLDEARLVAGLDHPNIVQTHDLGRAGDRYFIAMEYVDGSDLARLIEAVSARGERVPLPCALGILCRICDGLHAAHTAVGPDNRPLWLVHRDVKSANVFVSRTGAVKVGDFGIAKATHAVRISRTEVGQVKGTPGTMAPEQRLGQEVDRRADVYGVGAIAYELLSGGPVNLDLVALAARGIAGWPHLPPLASQRPDLPSELDAIIIKALAYDPQQRYEDCAALEADLRAVGSQVAGGLAEDKAIGAWARRELDRGVVAPPPVAPSTAKAP